MKFSCCGELHRSPERDTYTPDTHYSEQSPIVEQPCASVKNTKDSAAEDITPVETVTTTVYPLISYLSSTSSTKPITSILKNTNSRPSRSRVRTSTAVRNSRTKTHFVTFTNNGKLVSNTETVTYQNSLPDETQLSIVTKPINTINTVLSTKVLLIAKVQQCYTDYTDQQVTCCPQLQFWNQNPTSSFYLLQDKDQKESSKEQPINSQHSRLIEPSISCGQIFNSRKSSDTSSSYREEHFSDNNSVVINQQLTKCSTGDETPSSSSLHTTKDKTLAERLQELEINTNKFVESLKDAEQKRIKKLSQTILNQATRNSVLLSIALTGLQKIGKAIPIAFSKNKTPKFFTNKFKCNPSPSCPILYQPQVKKDSKAYPISKSDKDFSYVNYIYIGTSVYPSSTELQYWYLKEGSSKTILVNKNSQEPSHKGDQTDNCKSDILRCIAVSPKESVDYSSPPSPASTSPILFCNWTKSHTDSDWHRFYSFDSPLQSPEPPFLFEEPAHENREKYSHINDNSRRPSYADTSSGSGICSHVLSGDNRNSKSEELYTELYDLERNSQVTWQNDDVGDQPMGRMNPLEDHERKIIIEFCHLLEKSKQLFNGLRELPQYGHKQWHSYFGRTFDVYTKLWKFQQQHRRILDTKYGLKRWQIGEIASKIGQLYYHFYLRTSEIAYLHEAYSFYYAIRGRCYYTKASKEDKCELMVKKLRYYARFIVVCLLLKKVKLVKELIKELDRQIIDYGATYDPDDQIEWTVVVDEVKAFIQAEPIITVMHPDNVPVILSHRLSPMVIPPVERSSLMNLTLQEILIIGSSSQQVKFSELTMDMFRMLQTLEREPNVEAPHLYDDSPRNRFPTIPNAAAHKGYNSESSQRNENPHKYLLFKPSAAQILVYLASGCNDLPPNGALLLYISADGQLMQSSKHPEDASYDMGGLITTSRTDLYRDSKICNSDRGSGAPPPKAKECQCFFPGDIHPYTRRPMFIIVDSNNSYIFQHLPRHFGQPLVVLMSPMETPPSFNDRRNQGNLFTLFLHSPLSAVCYICDIHTLPLGLWERCQGLIDTFMFETSQMLTRSRTDPSIIAFMGDDFLRLLLIRFIFCEVVLRMHRGFRTIANLTRSSPRISDEIYDHPTLTHIVLDLANQLQVRSSFHEPLAGAAAPLPTRE